MINKTKDYLTTPNAVKISNKNVNNTHRKEPKIILAHIVSKKVIARQ